MHHHLKWKKIKFLNSFISTEILILIFWRVTLWGKISLSWKKFFWFFDKSKLEFFQTLLTVKGLETAVGFFSGKCDQSIKACNREEKIGHHPNCVTVFVENNKVLSSDQSSLVWHFCCILFFVSYERVLSRWCSV